MFGAIPWELGGLGNLVKLHLDRNKLSALWDHTENANDIGHEEGTHRTSGGPMPSQLYRLLEVLEDLHFRETWDWSLASLELHFNPWAEPPESVVAEGLKSVRGYFEDLYADPCRIKRRSVKVILVRQEGARKTSNSRLVNKSDGSLRGSQMVLPRSWDISLAVLEALEHGRDPVEVVLRKSPDRDREDATETARGAIVVYQGFTVEDLSSKWQKTVDELKRRGITVTNAENALEGALSIREFDGSLIRHEKFVFLDVVWLARILKPLLNHKDQETFDGLVNLGDTGDARITLDDPSDIASWDRLKSQGVLEPRLGYAIWPNGLSKYDDPAEDVVVLLRLNPERPESVGHVIDTCCLEHTPALSASWKIFLGVPPGAIGEVLTRCCGLGGVRTFWRYGVLVHGGLGELGQCGIFAVVLEYSSMDNELVAQIFGDISTPAPWVALDFPGLRWRGSLTCPQHGDTMLLANKCSPETRGLGAAAIDLVRMVDIRLGRDVIFDEAKARFDVVGGQYAFPRPTVKVQMKEGFGDAKAGFDDTKAGFDDTKAGFDEVKATVDELKGGFGEVQGEMKRGFDDTKAEFGDVKNELAMVKKKLDKVAESTQESLMHLKDLQAPNYPYPHLVVVKEVGSNGTSSNAHGVKRWLGKLRGVGKKDMTLHFLCPEKRGWVKKVSPVIQVAVVTANVALKATTGVDVDMSHFLKGVKDGLVEEVVDRTLDEDALLRVISSEEDIGAGMQQDARASYEAVKKCMEKEEFSRRKTARRGDGYIDFRDEVTRVTDGRGRMEWVRKRNV
ncbi:LRR-GTPase of the ROCO family, putative pseudogene [Ectocarpus siliculosus]|nr:LRR-GTPase of the ROCO family, putative pseudogene [Ectocarpus siliculosus]|eukprot:CBN78371.1 LRR-GTPase of the ROCO family, putative pseudogene [Ectocarpus siliculosus]